MLKYFIIVDCLMGEWGEWSSFICSNPVKLCGECFKTRNKEIIRNCQYGGKCDCEREEDKVPQHRECYYDCQMAPWGEWTTWSCEKRNGELSVDKRGHRWRVQPVLQNCSISHAKRIPDEGHDCSCSEQVEENSKEMSECGLFVLYSITTFSGEIGLEVWYLFSMALFNKTKLELHYIFT